MTAFVTDAAGVRWQLPDPLSWELESGFGTPCDSFLLRLPWRLELEAQTREWVGFYAEREGARVFTGLVDECVLSADQGGCTLTLAGRGMAARLLDNEALGRDYQVAALGDILAEHVAPYGIETVGGEGLPHVSRFRVDTGSSEWTVLTAFLRACGGEEPRFDPYGRLVLEEKEVLPRLRIGTDTPVTALVRREERYGVVSQVLVRDGYSGAVCSVRDEGLSPPGSMARRVLTLPGRPEQAAMVRAGREQLRRSASGWEQVELTLPLPFAAAPGQRVDIQRPGWSVEGLYRVRRCTAGMDEDGEWSRLSLERE